MGYPQAVGPTPEVPYVILPLLVQEILGGRPEPRNWIQMLQSGRIENSRKVRRMLGGIHCNLHGTIGDNGNGPFGIASRPPQRPADWAPGPSEVMKIEAFAFEGICQRVECGRLIPSGAKLAHVVPPGRS